MSAVFSPVQPSKKISAGIILACALVAVTGCSRSDKNEKTETKSQTTTTTTTTKVEKKAAVDCANPAVNSAIAQALTSQIQQTATRNLVNVGQQAGVNLDSALLQDNLSQLSVVLGNIRGSDSQCQASVIVTMPQTAMDNANRIFERLREPNLAAKATSLGFRTQDNTLIGDNQVFSLTPAAGTYQVSLERNQDLINLVSDVMTNSTLGQTVVKTSGTTNTATATAPRRQATHSTSNQASAHSQRKNTERQNNEHQANERQVARSERQTRDTTDRQLTARSTASKNSTNQATATAKNSTTELDKPATTTTVTKTVKPSQTSSTEHKAATEATSKPVATGNQQLPSDDGLKLSIEEKNEKY